MIIICTEIEAVVYVWHTNRTVHMISQANDHESECADCEIEVLVLCIRLELLLMIRTFLPLSANALRASMEPGYGFWPSWSTPN